MIIKNIRSKTRTTLLVLLVIAMISQISSCASNSSSANQPQSAVESLPKDQIKVGQIYLFGESHSNPIILDTEFNLWKSYYHTKNMRHLFVELPYFTSEYLNLWMKSDNDEILKQIFNDIKGTAACSEASFAFYKKIKSECPETIFHGVDVGHAYASTGERYLKYLLESGESKSSEKYQKAKESIEQGKHYYSKQDHVFRENKMVENFIREYNQLDGADVMGIFGGAHTDPKGMNWKTQEIPGFANQLTQYYGKALHTRNLANAAGTPYFDAPISVETKVVAGKEYTASYFGEVDLSKLTQGYQSRRFWRLENAYDDFKDNPSVKNVLTYDNYPMPIETGQILLIEYTLKSGSVRTEYHRANGKLENNQPATEQFVPVVETKVVAGKEYTASYFGEVDLSKDGNLGKTYQSRRFWRLENAYDDFKDNPAISNVLPYDNYPMPIEMGQILIVEYTLKDGTVRTDYYRANGTQFENRPATQQFFPIVETKVVNEKEYKATYLGEIDLSKDKLSNPYLSRHVWRLENAYDDFKDNPGVNSPFIYYDMYPAPIADKQILVIESVLKDGTTETIYHRSGEHKWDNKPTTVEIMGKSQAAVEKDLGKAINEKLNKNKKGK